MDPCLALDHIDGPWIKDGIFVLPQNGVAECDLLALVVHNFLTDFEQTGKIVLLVMGVCAVFCWCWYVYHGFGIVILYSIRILQTPPAFGHLPLNPSTALRASKGEELRAGLLKGFRMGIEVNNRFCNCFLAS